MKGGGNKRVKKERSLGWNQEGLKLKLIPGKEFLNSSLK